MAQQRTVAAAEDRRKALPLTRDRPVPDRVDAMVHRVQASRMDLA